MMWCCYERKGKRSRRRRWRSCFKAMAVMDHRVSLVMAGEMDGGGRVTLSGEGKEGRVQGGCDMLRETRREFWEREEEEEGRTEGESE